MTNEDMYNGITDIKDSIILEADTYEFKKKRSGLRKPAYMLVAAACLCLVAGVSAFVISISNGSKKPSGISDNEGTATPMQRRKLKIERIRNSLRIFPKNRENPVGRQNYITIARDLSLTARNLSLIYILGTAVSNAMKILSTWARAGKHMELMDTLHF